MPAQNTAPAADEQAVSATAAASHGVTAAAVKAWAVTAYGIADHAGLTLAQANGLVQASANLDAFKDAVIDAIATKPADRPSVGAGAAVVLADGGDKFREGISRAVLSMAGIIDRDPENEFNGITPTGIALAVLAQNSVRAAFDKRKFVAAAITHTSGDFASITANIMEKAMMKGFEEQPETFDQWCGKGVLTDFKQGRRVGLNAIPSLPTIGEAGEFQYLTTGDRFENVQLATAGGIISLTRQAIINDDLGAFVDLPRKLGRAAKRTIGDTVYAILIGNPTMSDGVTLFHAATHKNLATGGGSALSTTSLITGSTAMATQLDRSAAGAALNIDPAFLITSRALRPLAQQLMGSTAEIGATNAGVANRVANLAKVISDARIDRAAGGSTKWFLAGDPNIVSTIEVQYLNGVESPYIEQGLEFDVDGVRLKVRHDFGAKALQWEGLYYAAGA
jgi:phage major head subunit gpT-like protein